MLGRYLERSARRCAKTSGVSPFGGAQMPTFETPAARAASIAWARSGSFAWKRTPV
jgi:hypothetical protein